jgi:hypothetical protein
LERDSTEDPVIPPELFSGLKALRVLIVEKPSWQPPIASELNVFRFRSKSTFESTWSRVEAVGLWKTHCPRLVSVKIYGRKLEIMKNQA